jgi:hypothetical protein
MSEVRFVVNLKEKISQDLAVQNIILPDSTFRENLFITKTNKQGQDIFACSLISNLKVIFVSLLCG